MCVVLGRFRLVCHGAGDIWMDDLLHGGISIAYRCFYGMLECYHTHTHTKREREREREREFVALLLLFIVIDTQALKCLIC
jgi:hypothetical protein